MQLGMIGLGRMGSNMVRRLMRAGHECVVFDVHPEAVRALGGEGAVATSSLAAFVTALSEPRDAIEDIYEPFLLQIGFLDRTPRGRVATKLAYDHFQRTMPNQNAPQKKLF